MAQGSQKDSSFDYKKELNLNELYTYDDDAAYPEYDLQEALEIVEEVVIILEEEQEEILDLPLEQDETVEVLEETKPLSIGKIIDDFVEIIFSLGDSAIEIITFWFKKLSPIVVVPFYFILSFSAKFFKKILPRIFRSPIRFARKVKKALGEISVLKRQAFKAEKHKLKTFSNLLYKYLVLSFTRHKYFWTTLANVAIPCVILIVGIIIFSSSSTEIYALEVYYNDQSIGYIESQDTFEKAQTTALSMINSEAAEDLKEHKPTYQLKKVGLNQLSNSSMLSENIISASTKDYALACGIYIDGEFLCAVQNESDAISAFDNIIAPIQDSAKKGTTVAFVEQIDYIQGYYPQDSDLIWDSLKLFETLNNPKTVDKTYKVKNKDTAETIAKDNALSLNQLETLNPTLNLSKLKTGDIVYTSRKSNYVRIKEMVTQTRKQTIKYESIKKDSSSLTKGTTKVSQEGQNGEYVITELVTYIDNKISYTSEISKVQTKAPVDKITLIGTKEIVVSTPSGTIYTPSNSSSTGFIWPTYGAYSISSYYGYRTLYGRYSFHGGLDIIKSGGYSAGTPVIASKAGTVVAVVRGYSGYGHYVLIDHGNGYQTRYAHMLVGSLTVYVGQHVSRGQQIGQIGSTGNSTGPHLHFEVIYYGTRMNPLNYIG